MFEWGDFVGRGRKGVEKKRKKREEEKNKNKNKYTFMYIYIHIFIYTYIPTHISKQQNKKARKEDQICLEFLDFYPGASPSSISQVSYKYYSNCFIVKWENILLYTYQDPPSNEV